MTWRVAIVFCLVGAGGCFHAQTGPLVGYSPGQGPMVGWEGGAGYSLLSGKLGAELRPFGDRVAELYVAGEPALALQLPNGADWRNGMYLSAGGTVGLSVDEHGTGGALAGGFIGVPWLRGGDCRDEWVSSASVSVGVRVFVLRDEPQWTVYAAPKLGVVGKCADLRITAFRN